jgi:hypothetical protein
MNAVEHFKDLYGAMDLSENDTAKRIFLSGWNSALLELMERLYAMPMEKDTRASFQVYMQNMMQLDPHDLK